MRDVLFGLLAIAAGSLFCFAGFLAFRIVIPLWGAFVGFAVGAGIVASGDDGFLRTGLSWIVGLAFALLFALLAYFFYEVAVVLAMGSIGIALGTGVMVALGVSWTWVVVLVAIAVGVLLAFVAIAANMPMILLVVLSATGGATAITAGLMLLTGAIDTADFDQDQVTAHAADDWWWYVVYAALVVAGLVVQLRAAAGLTRSMRQSWESGRGTVAAPPPGSQP